MTDITLNNKLILRFSADESLASEFQLLSQMFLSAKNMRYNSIKKS